MINIPHSILLIAVTAVITFILRAVPFWVFNDKRQMPPAVKAIADKLPPAIIAVLVIYCLKGSMTVIGGETFITLIALIVVILLHIFKRNTLLSIAAGTVVYMIGLRLL